MCGTNCAAFVRELFCSRGLAKAVAGSWYASAAGVLVSVVRLAAAAAVLLAVTGLYSISTISKRWQFAGRGRGSTGLSLRIFVLRRPHEAA
jgi:uncharacterized membrane protein YdbT with pleckstrin-like domain